MLNVTLFYWSVLDTSVWYVFFFLVKSLVFRLSLILHVSFTVDLGYKTNTRST